MSKQYIENLEARIRELHSQTTVMKTALKAINVSSSHRNLCCPGNLAKALAKETLAKIDKLEQLNEEE